MACPWCLEAGCGTDHTEERADLWAATIGLSVTNVTTLPLDNGHRVEYANNNN